MANILYRIGHFAGRHPWRVSPPGCWSRPPPSRSTPPSAVSPTRPSPSPAPSHNELPTRSRTASRRRPSTRSNVIFHADDGLTEPAAKAAVEQAVTQLAEGTHVIGVSDPYDPRGPTVSKDGTTAFATVAFDTQEIGPEEFDAAEKPSRSLRDAGIQVEYDGGLGYAKGDAEPGSEKIGILVAVVVLAIAFGSLVAMSLPIVVALVGHPRRHQRHRHRSPA